ncbi:MAG: ferritin-like domain-containing protein [Methylophilus sp.]
MLKQVPKLLPTERILRKIIPLLNASLATELVCMLRYKRHYFMARGIHSKSIAETFNLHANEELAHADLIADL